MNASSEYTFPIFISSTDYNLKDLRAELARFLEESGYKPVLSSAEGFPDSSPKFEPWESCLPALEHSFVMSLIIDGRYGEPLDWPNFKEIFENRKLSPTHAEYIFAHKAKKRMLVFIRKELMAYYQSYRTVLNNEKIKEKDSAKLRERIKSVLTPTLPKNIDFEALEFVAEVKTKKPIPWIMEFEDVTDVKTKMQKKMLNELAEVFLIKSMRFETVIDALNKILDGLSEEEQQKALKKINVTKDFPEINKKIEELEDKLKESNEKLSKTQASKKRERSKLENEVKNLNEEINDLKRKSMNYGSSNFFIEDGKIRLDDFGNFGSSLNLGTTGSINIGTTSELFSSSYNDKCDECGKHEYDHSIISLIPYNQLRTCPSCNKHLCSSCWPKIENSLISGIVIGEQCPKCTKEVK
ncbi:DUF4062 domain-containing protein [Confluentibacter citreus]|uniref:DUF4062 domain-containing protein n=1 Tax=Confluentibacter citreus TaxID=2007307 RepID=UPI000C2907DB|nr:DUF4062 domain-containing protein [Confluentibacter citreus]